MSERTLERDHRRLAALLRPGMRVLDVGCGDGGISSGIARAVGPSGFVLAIDNDPQEIEAARRNHAGLPNLAFEVRDILDFRTELRFDVVTAARTLQWIAEPEAALRRMVCASRPGGVVLVLDYNHLLTSWDPPPPAPLREFYDALLDWRAAMGCDNAITERLPGMFAGAGLEDITISVEDEVAGRGDPGATIWPQVIGFFAPKLAATGCMSAAELEGAARVSERWCREKLVRQVLVARAVQGRTATTEISNSLPPVEGAG